MISLLYAGNAAMFDGLLISALSTIRHTTEPIHAFWLTMDLRSTNPNYAPLTEEHRAYIEHIYRRVAPESRVTLLDVGQLYRQALSQSPNNRSAYTPYSMLRLLADRLPQLPDKLLYLDADIIINGDIAPLFHTELGEHEYAAVLDHYGQWFMGYHYSNSGVMLLNMVQLRCTRLFSRAVELCRKRRLFLPDQTALHRLTEKKLLLPRQYNEQKDYNRSDTVLQHFTKTIIWLPFFHTRTIKPWQTALVSQKLTHRYDALLEEYTQEKNRFEEGHHG